jgi:hypothetical protein
MNWEDFSDKINQSLKENELLRIVFYVILIPPFLLLAIPALVIMAIGFLFEWLNG